MNDHLRLTFDDLSVLKGYFPKLNFDRQEQMDALLHGATADFQAAPGSGKTTLLGAKLALMAEKWPYAHRGICILTHTNVAREEIEHCLKSVPHGESLLGYPHFIGTIQSFVNKFIALPWLRTLGISPREVDEEDFSERFYNRAYWFAKPWIQVDQWQRSQTIRRVRYSGQNLDLVSDANTPLPASGNMINKLRQLKASMANEGRLRHEDMFAYAEQALARVSDLADTVQHRFPNVFIDEMQDTNDIQLKVLSLIFRTGSTVQRFGDVNQSILNRGSRSAPNSFPLPNSLEVRTSLRFGKDIATIANRVKAHGGDIDGRGPTCASPPLLILFSDESIQDVISRFGSLVGDLLPNEAKEGALPIKAICAIKSEGNQKQRVGRYIGDYFPEFDPAAAASVGNQRSVRKSLRLAGLSGRSGPLSKRIGASRTVLLLIIQQFGIETYRQARNWQELATRAADRPKHLARLRALALEFITNPLDVSTDKLCEASIDAIVCALDDLLDKDLVAEGNPGEWLQDEVASQARTQAITNAVTVTTQSHSFPIHVATIASVKGETHLATLVLESCRNRRFDLQDALPYLSGSMKASSTTDEATLSQLMNIFVAASRPRVLLAFAMHAERASAAHRKALASSGWRILDWTTAVAC